MVRFVHAVFAVSVVLCAGAPAFADQIFNHDLELGSRLGWVTTGTAFNNQPTHGDNSAVRGKPSNLEGEWWVGTYENYQGPLPPSGATQGDGPTGTLTSWPFVLNSSTIDLLVGAGNHPWGVANPTCVNLERLDGTVLKTEPGADSEFMTRRTWDVSAHVGETLVIKAYDMHSSSWGHINFDDVNADVTYAPWPATIPNPDFETGDRTGWSATGTAFNNQPTYGDNPVARGFNFAASGSNPHWPNQTGVQGDYFIGTFENRPTPSDPAGGTQGEAPQGTLTSMPFTITGDAISFLIGGGKHPWATDPQPTCANLETLDGSVLRTSTGHNTEAMYRVHWGTRGLVGQTAVVRLYDLRTSSLGHINFDDLQLGLTIPGGTNRAVLSNPDFETGDLSGWTIIDGNAFQNQPTYGDNPAARSFNFAAYGSNPAWPNQTGVQGDYFIGTYEDRHTPADPPAGRQGDGPMGVLESEVFTLEHVGIMVRVGGGNHPWPASAVWDPSNLPWTPGLGPSCINLERPDGTVLFTATGRNTEAMWDVWWDVQEYMGEALRLRIYDQHSGSWGHVNVDYIRFIPEPATLALLGIGSAALALRRRRR